MGRRFTQINADLFFAQVVQGSSSYQTGQVGLSVQGTVENVMEFLIILKISVHLRPELSRVKGENWGYLFELVVSYSLSIQLNIGHPIIVKQNMA